VQERLTQQVADAMWEHLEPAGVGVVLRARHMCVESRGIQHRGNSTTTTALHGVMKSQPDTRAEFMSRAVTDTVI
jgi:GTP cyclohydrolase I